MQVPIKIDGVVVGLASISEGSDLQINIVTKNTKTYLSEGILMGLFDSLSLAPNFYPPDEVPLQATHGHLRLI